MFFISQELTNIDHLLLRNRPSQLIYYRKVKIHDFALSQERSLSLFKKCKIEELCLIDLEY